MTISAMQMSDIGRAGTKHDTAIITKPPTNGIVARWRQP